MTLFQASTADCDRDAVDMSASAAAQLGYAAGIIDGEGCIFISKTRYPGRANPTYRLVLSVSQNHLGLLERVTKVLEVPRRIYAVPRTLKMNRDAYQLHISDQHALAALRALEPHLTRKAPEAAVAIDVYLRGKMNVHPGPKGHPREVWKIR